MQISSAFIIVAILGMLTIGIATVLIILIIRALLKYIKGKEVRKNTLVMHKTLADALKEHRIHSKMTQEFVAECLSVSRQAVSKWETGLSEPSTNNLIALAKLYRVSAEELLKEVNT